MYSIELSISSITSAAFGILEAGIAYATSGTLYTGGCSENNVPGLNCSSACQDPRQIFSNPYTLQNCMVLSALAPNSLTQGANLSDSSIIIASTFAIDVVDRDFPSLAGNVTRTIQDCLGEYYPQNYSNFFPWYYRGYSIHSTYSTNTTGIPVYNIACSPEGGALNADIGGIGVWISYWMQSGIALSAFLLLKLFDDQFYRWSIFFCYLFYPFGLWLIGLPNIKYKASVLQARLRTYAPAVKSATVEFHKAQCFFMLAIELAANLVISEGTLNDSTTSTTLQGLADNYNLLGSVSISGFIPVTFTLLVLHRAGIHSWYLVILSNCAIVLSAVTMFRVGDFKISTAERHNLMDNNAAGHYPTCGNKDPTAFCFYRPFDADNLTSMRNLGSGYIGGPGLLFTCIILALINLDHLGLQRTSWYEGSVRWLLSWLDSFLRKQHKRKNHRSAQHLLAISKDCLYFLIWGWYVTFIVFSMQGLYDPSNGTILSPVNSWTFGQIVAITVWAGPLLEFVKLSVQGLKRGLDYRTPHPYSITNLEDDAEAQRHYQFSFRWTRPAVEEEPVFKMF